MSSSSSSSPIVSLGDGFDDAFERSADRCVQLSPRHHAEQHRHHHDVRCDPEALLDVAWRMAVQTTVTEENASTVSSVEEIFERVDAVAETLALEALGRRLGDGCAGDAPPPLRLVSPERDDDDYDDHAGVLRTRADDDGNGAGCVASS